MERRRLMGIAGLALALGGCSLNQLAVERFGEAIAQGGATFASEEDPQLVEAAAPFSLKLMESLIAESPRHGGLLAAASKGFTQYAYAFVQQDADEAREAARAKALRERARRLYRRAYGYGMRALDVAHPGFAEAFARDSRAALLALTHDDAERLYWTTVARAAEISLSLDSMPSLSGLREVDQMVGRLLDLDPDMDHGALHVFLVGYEMARPGARKPEQRAREHFEAALRLSEGALAGPHVAYAESVCVARQDRREFVAQLERALVIDPAARPEWQLENRVMQRRARWLLGRADDFFLE
jgi:predicted anti-sigma-YlaC factor YlaD